MDHLGRTRQELIEFLSDMLVSKDDGDKNIANTILEEYYGGKDPDSWSFRMDLIVEYYIKLKK